MKPKYEVGYKFTLNPKDGWYSALLNRVYEISTVIPVPNKPFKPFIYYFNPNHTKFVSAICLKESEIIPVRKFGLRKVLKLWLK